MSMQTKIIIAGAILSIMILSSVNSLAFAQYVSPQGNTGLDDYIQLAKDRVKISNENPGTGSGTPLFAADGVLGSLVLSTGIFGGIATAFFVKGRQGKYAAMGRG